MTTASNESSVLCTRTCVSVYRTIPNRAVGKVPRAACKAYVFVHLYRRCSPQLGAENFFQLVQ